MWAGRYQPTIEHPGDPEQKQTDPLPNIPCVIIGTTGRSFMRKKVAVIVTDGQQEALRMAVGLTLADNAVTVFVMEHPLEPGEMTDLNLQTLGEMGAEIFSTIPGNRLTLLSTDAVARMLVEFDAVIPY